jgi:hypothetical protein
MWCGYSPFSSSSLLRNAAPARIRGTSEEMLAGLVHVALTWHRRDAAGAGNGARSPLVAFGEMAPAVVARGVDCSAGGWCNLVLDEPAGVDGRVVPGVGGNGQYIGSRVASLCEDTPSQFVNIKWLSPK